MDAPQISQPPLFLDLSALIAAPTTKQSIQFKPYHGRILDPVCGSGGMSFGLPAFAPQTATANFVAGPSSAMMILIS